LQCVSNGERTISRNRLAQPRKKLTTAGSILAGSGSWALLIEVQSTKSQTATVRLIAWICMERVVIRPCYAGVGEGAQVTSVLVLTHIFGVPLEAATEMGLVLWLVSFVAILPGLRAAERGAA
jgi:hypothetical protein